MHGEECNLCDCWAVGSLRGGCPGGTGQSLILVKMPRPLAERCDICAKFGRIILQCQILTRDTTSLETPALKQAIWGAQPVSQHLWRQKDSLPFRSRSFRETFRESHLSASTTSRSPGRCHNEQTTQSELLSILLTVASRNPCKTEVKKNQEKDQLWELTV